MPASRRAKQFMAFDALKGLKEAIAARERLTEPRKELSEDRIREISDQLLRLQPGQMVTVVYYCAYEQSYLQLTGPVTKVDGYWCCLQVGQTMIDFTEIYGLF